jgi:5-carboxymethyl-2-hydroxymuconate isomerase
MGGRLPDDVRQVITSAVQADLGDEALDLSFAVSSHDRAIVSVRAILRATSSLDAVTRLDTSVNSTLMASGLFEEFDVSGKVLRAVPVELTDQGRPDDMDR